MNRVALIPAVFAIDQIAGDPEWLPHPVRLMGIAIEQGERTLRRPQADATREFATGALLTAMIVLGSYALTRRVILHAYRCSRRLGLLTELLFGWTCLAARSLQQEAVRVIEAMERNDIPAARRRLAHIVGRDTERLNEAEISRAVIETLAESASDGIVAPLFYMAVGGVPLAMAYKAVNTLDSMIGHADEHYEYFGKIAACFDDAANYLPARASACAIVMAALINPLADADAASKTWLRDGSKHKSPNAGQPESAMAGALHVRLGGTNCYLGERIPAAYLGADFPAPSIARTRDALRLVSAVTIIAVGAATVLAAFRSPSRLR